MKTEDYLALNFKDNMTIPELGGSRRDFVKGVTGGILILLAMGDLAEAQEAAKKKSGGRGNAPADFNAYLRIHEDGKVTCFTGKVEMGQGTITSLPQMVAEELDLPVESVSIVMGDTAQCPWDMGTFGSQTTRAFGPSLCTAAAEAKAVLLELAADSLKVPADRLVAKDGAIFDREHPDQRVTYGQLAKGQKIERHVNATSTLSKPAQFKHAGKPLIRRDSHDKVTGAAHYAGDIRVPGMLYASILRPPAHGAKLKSADVAAAKEMPGVTVVQQDGIVAVLHAHPDMAERALKNIKAEFDTPEPKVNQETIFDHLMKVVPEARVVGERGSVEAGLRSADKKFEATYLTSYVAHAAMETHTALVQIEDDKATIWASTQNPFGVQRDIAELLGLPAKNVHVIAPFLGGGFGGKSHNPQVVEAARLARITGKPVQVCFTRGEEFFYDTFRPAAIVKISSGVDAAGKLTLWDYNVYYAGERGASPFYSVPNEITKSYGAGWGTAPGTHPFGTGAWRGPGNGTNSFARESHIDVMAAAAGMDPVEFRLLNLKDERMIRLLQAAADKFGWQAAKAPSKRGFGVACGTDAGTYVAAIAEVEVNKTKGDVQVKRVVCAQDMGVIINPEGARIQVEGCITMGLGCALSEEIRFEGGKILDTNFDTYSLPRFSWVPEIETVLMDSKETMPQGGGEPAITIMGALIANAVFDATGARIYQMPLTPERVKEAIRKV